MATRGAAAPLEVGDRPQALLQAHAESSIERRKSAWSSRPMPTRPGSFGTAEVFISRDEDGAAKEEIHAPGSCLVSARIRVTQCRSMPKASSPIRFAPHLYMMQSEQEDAEQMSSGPSG